MLNKDQIASASRILHGHWRAGTKFDGLDAGLRPRDRAEGYAIQANIETCSSGKLFGWEIAATSEAGGSAGRRRYAASGDRDSGFAL